MGKYASGKFALRISDRSGMAFPYNEMVREWTGSWVHYSEFEPKQPQLDPKNHPKDFTALEHAKPQIADSRVYVGNNTVRSPTGDVVLSPNLDVFDGVGDGTAVNSFQTLLEPVTNYYANGVAYADTQRSMMPLSVQQPQRTTGLLSRTGNVTVTTS
tara:strand:- start:220 stop:690 length:471 start_codon:yes stop_codon:yes gene_type:complete